MSFFLYIFHSYMFQIIKYALILDKDNQSSAEVSRSDLIPDFD